MFGYGVSGGNGVSPTVEEGDWGTWETHLRSRKYLWDLAKAGPQILTLLLWVHGDSVPICPAPPAAAAGSEEVGESLISC